MSLKPIASPLSPKSPKSEPLFDESLELSEGSRFQEDFGSSTITPASTTPVTAPVEQQAACCLTRCLSYLGEQIFDFFDWVCSLFVSSKPATLESIKTAMEEILISLKKLKDYEGLQQSRYKNLETDTSNKLDKDKRFNNACLYFADAIELTGLGVTIVEILVKWGLYGKRFEEPLKLESGPIITERMLRSDKRKILSLSQQFCVLTHTPFPPYSVERSKAIVEDFCLGRTTIEKDGGMCSLIDLNEGGEFIAGLWNLTPEFRKITSQERERVTAQFEERIKELGCRIGVRYAGIKPDNIEGDSAVIALLADAIEIFTRYDGVLKGDISNTSAIKVRLQELETLLNSDPLFKAETPAMRKAVTCFDFNTRFNLAGREGPLVHHVSWHQIKDYRLSNQVKQRCEDVIDTLQNPPANNDAVSQESNPEYTPST